jgi:cell division protein FtsQ
MMPRLIADTKKKTFIERQANGDVARRYRIMARSSAVAFLLTALVQGMALGGAFDYAGSPYPRFAGKLASLAGMASDDIEITGLQHHDPEQLLNIIKVTAGGSLINFDPVKAKTSLERQNWIEAAAVKRVFPNALAITVTERTPFAIWQQGNRHYVIDRKGVAMSGLNALELKLPLLTGEGANFAAEEIVNHIVANPGLMSKIAAAARVGDRRWTLYLDNGVRVLLPEQGLSEALAYVEKVHATQGLLDKGVSEIDLRVAGEMRIAVAEVKQEPKPQPN